MFVDSSKDILYLVISFCILWVTVFLCWMLYYVMRLLRNANQIVEEFRVRLQSLTDAVSYIKGKVEHISGLMTMMTNGVGGVVSGIVKKKAKEWMANRSDNFDDAAKEAVDRAVAATAHKMKKTASRIRNKE